MNSVLSKSKHNGDLTQGEISEDMEQKPETGAQKSCLLSPALYAKDILMLSDGAVLMQILLIMR